MVESLRLRRRRVRFKLAAVPGRRRTLDRLLLGAGGDALECGEGIRSRH